MCDDIIIINDTPIIKYNVSGKIISVKRDDMISNDIMSPRNSKIRGLDKFLCNLPHRKIGVLDTRIGTSGWAVSYVANKLGNFEVYVFYPRKKSDNITYINNSIEMSEKLGSTIIPLQATRNSIVYSRATKYMSTLGGTMVPMGLALRERVDATAYVSEIISKQYSSIVVCMGSGTTYAGIYKGITENTMLYGISVGMNINKQKRRIESLIDTKLNTENSKLILPENTSYNDSCIFPSPFPCSAYYDRKAWKWLNDNIDILKEPILFWNIGV